MNKCNECLCLFEKPKEIKDEGYGILYCCPNCKETDYENVLKCSECGQWVYPSEIHKNICYECARELYTFRLGTSFIDRHKEEFFIEFVWGIGKPDKDNKIELIKVLESDYYSNLIFNDEEYYLGECKENQIKEFCLDDIVVWIEFLKGELYGRK